MSSSRLVVFALSLGLVVGGCDLGEVAPIGSGAADGGTDEPSVDAGPDAPRPDAGDPVLAGCNTCHGDAESTAPPRNLAGETDPTADGVGAHRVHLAVGDWYEPVACASCHQVPATIDAPGHIDGDNVVEVPFGTKNPAGTFDQATSTCGNLYCHGDGRGDNGTAVWTDVTPMTCTSCHQTDAMASGEHRKHINGENMECTECHGDVVDGNRTVIGAALHINRANDVRMAQGTYDLGARRCSNLACHGAETW